MLSYLIVANQTLVSDTVVDLVATLFRNGPCQLHVVVPATRQQERLTWTTGAALAVARRRLDHALTRFGRLPAEITGEVGDENPVLAVMDVILSGRPIDEVILCTLPAGMSAWLKRDLPNRVQRRISIPVRHVAIRPDHTGEMEIIAERRLRAA